LELAVECSYLTTSQVHQLSSPREVAPQVSQAESRGPRVGQVFDSYFIVKELGRGGMGAVYHGQKDGFDYALKFLHGDNLELERFRREAEAVARVDKHPNIVRIHSYSQAERRPYIVFDFLTGGDLKSRLKERKCFSEESALHLLSQLASGLAHIHSHHILHRDLKPENILFDDADRPQISDFGLAYSVTLETLTKTGHSLGTAAYMAPEQIDNLHSELCPATDTWALGVILYELLSGEKPFKGLNAIQYAKKIVTQPTPQIRTMKPEISKVTESLILKALEKDAANRFQSASEFEQACLAALGSASEPFAIPSLIKQAKTWKRRAFTLTALSLISLAIYVYGQNIDDYLFDLRVSTKLKTQSETIKKELDKSNKQVPIALAQLLLQSSGSYNKKQQGPGLVKDSRLLEEFDQYIQELESIPRFYQNSNLDRLRQQQSLLSQYWSSQEAFSNGEEQTLNKRLSKDWRRLFGAYKLFLEEDYISARKRYTELEEQLPPNSVIRDLSYLGKALSEAKLKKWKRASKSCAQISSKSIHSHWIEQLRFHLNEQEALDLLFGTQNTLKSQRDRIKELEQSWSQLFAKIENEDPSIIKNHWDSWNMQINAALKKGDNRKAVMFYIDFLARYWRAKPELVKPELNHKSLQKSLKSLFAQGQAKRMKDSYGVIFNHFLSIRQFDRSFKMDLTFLIQDKLDFAGVIGTVETEIDWLESVTRLPQRAALSFQKKKQKRQSSLSEILFQISLIASQQGVYLPLDQSILLELDEAKLLDNAVDVSENDIYPRFWRAQLNPFDFRKTARNSSRKMAALYKRSYDDFQYLRQKKLALPPRFLALVLRAKAQWHSSFLTDIAAKLLTEKQLGVPNDEFQSLICMKEAINYPHFRPDKAHYDYARYIPTYKIKKREERFQRALLELEKRQKRTLKRDFYVGRTLGEVVFPVRDYKKEKARYILFYLHGLIQEKSYAKAIKVAKKSLQVEDDKSDFERLLIHCYAVQKRWSDLDDLLAKKEMRERQQILETLFTEFKKDLNLSTELKKRYKKAQ
ncbi:MAG: serine/threonine-protein kinase, partial [Planctomycetota bacterium]|nr:serine/threonine-protein kinase [Planctomycetota bacterium]